MLCCGLSRASPMDDKLSVGLWNVDWAPPTSGRGRFFAQRLGELGNHVICITEGHAGNFPDGGHVITSEADYGYPIKAGGHKILLWSLNPWRDADTLGSPLLPGGRFVAATTDTPRGAVRFVGICIPWRAAHVSNGHRNRKMWEDHLTYLQHLPPLLQSNRSMPTVLLGDFNQRPANTATRARLFGTHHSTVSRLSARHRRHYCWCSEPCHRPRGNQRCTRTCANLFPKSAR